MSDLAAASPQNAVDGSAHRRWLGRRALSETVLTNIAILAFGAFTGIVTARTLGPDGRGALALAISVSGITALVAGLGLQQAFAYTVAARRDDVAKAVSLSLWTAVTVGGSAVIVGYPLAGVLSDEPTVTDAVRLALFSIPVNLILGHLIGVIQGLRWARPFNLLRVAVPAAFAVSLLVAIFADGSLSAQGVVALWLVALVVAAAAALVFIRSEMTSLRLPPWPFTRGVLRYGMIVNVGSIAWQANKYVALVVLGAVGTLAQVGGYSVAMGYALPVGVVALAIAFHTLPDIASAQGIAAQAVLARRRIGVAIKATAPLVVAGVLAAPLLIPLAFGSRFRGSVSAAQALVVAEALLALAHVLSEISRGMGRPVLPAVAATIGSIGAFSAIPIVVPQFGIQGAALATVAVYALMLGVLYLGLRRRLHHMV